jgi:hypothetical protein
MKREPDTKKFWWRWKEQSAGGESSYWTYAYSSARNRDQLEQELDQRGLLSTWSEHYRGVRCNKVSTIPLKELCEKIEAAANEMEAARMKHIELRNMKLSWYPSK